MSDHVGIVELGDVCAAMRARSLALFAQLGAWVLTTAPGEQQRLFAEACHRHAWHADLWEARTPTIQTTRATSLLSAVPTYRDGEDGEDGDDMRRDRYRSELSSLEDDLRSLHARFDPALDPSTARTVDLVGRDVVEIAERLDALRTR